MRESPAIPVINGLLSERAAIRAYDPIASREAKRIFRNRDIVFCDTLAEAIEDARVIIVLTRWEEFQTVPDLIREFGTQPLVIDGRRMLEKRSIERYAGIGL
jgi:UDPglucose 6-dehydrogenase/GDP-mannose 6-dehydrogenase